MSEIKLHARQILAEVFQLIEGNRYSALLIYDDNRLLGRIAYEELIAFLNYKKEAGDIYNHKLHFELGTVLNIVVEMRGTDAFKSSGPSLFTNKTLIRYGSAAVLAILLSAAWLFFKPATSLPVTQKIAVLSEEIASDKTVLDLGNGKRINVSDAGVGVIYSEPGMEVMKVCDTEIKYTVIDGQYHDGHGSNHTLTTPNAMQCQVALSDGTKIWVNAASSIKFPSTFVSLNSRRVSLNGEAYFEVASRKYQPFFVAAKDQEIQVLGTHFNVNAYRNEKMVKTTLLEGSLRVTDEALMQSVLLKPQQQAFLIGNKLSVVTLPADETAAWKEGEFIFRNMPLEDIMRVLERQYNVKVVYKKKDAKDSLLGGSILFSSKLPDVLNMLELTSNAHFKVEGDRVNVM